MIFNQLGLRRICVVSLATIWCGCHQPAEQVEASEAGIDAVSVDGDDARNDLDGPGAEIETEGQW